SVRLSRSRLPAIAASLGTAWGRGPVADVAVVDTERTIGGRAFACKRLSFRQTLGADDETAVAIWCSEDVRPLGLVAFELTRRARQPDGTDGLTIVGELAGLGSGERVAWGSAEASVFLWPPGSDELPPAPFASYADAKPGDFCC